MKDFNLKLEDFPDEAREILTAADANKAARDINGASTKYDEARKILEQKRGTDHVQYAYVLVRLSDTLMARTSHSGSTNDSNLNAASYALRRALAIVEMQEGPCSDRVLPILQRLMGVYDQAYNHTEADRILERYLTVRSERRLSLPPAEEQTQVAEG